MPRVKTPSHRDISSRFLTSWFTHLCASLSQHPKRHSNSDKCSPYAAWRAMRGVASQNYKESWWFRCPGCFCRFWLLPNLLYSLNWLLLFIRSYVSATLDASFRNIKSGLHTPVFLRYETLRTSRRDICASYKRGSSTL